MMEGTPEIVGPMKSFEEMKAALLNDQPEPTVRLTLAQIGEICAMVRSCVVVDDEDQ